MEANKEDSTFNSEKEILMYYHTTIRNVGLFTSIALAGISGARALAHGKSKHGMKNLYAIILLVLSATFLMMAIIIINLLTNDLNMARDNLNEPSLNNLLMVPKMALYVDVGLLFVIIGSFVSILI
jgi:hypothetical protein